MHFLILSHEGASLCITVTQVPIVFDNTLRLDLFLFVFQIKPVLLGGSVGLLGFASFGQNLCAAEPEFGLGTVVWYC